MSFRDHFKSFKHYLRFLIAMDWSFVMKDIEARFGVKVKSVKKLGGSPDKFNFLLCSATNNIKYIYKAKFSKPDNERGSFYLKQTYFVNISKLFSALFQTSQKNFLTDIKIVL